MKTTLILITASVLAALATGSVPQALQGAPSPQLSVLGRQSQSGFAQHASVIPTADPSVTSINALPFTINQPGYYRVTANLTGVAGNGGIIVTTSSRVVIDLNHFSLAGVPGSSNGISSPGSVTVFNGTIHGWQTGLAIFGEAEVYGVNSVLNAGDGMFLTGNAFVERCNVSVNGGNGLRGDRVVVVDSIFHHNGGKGLDAGADCFVQDSRFVANQGNGMEIDDGGTATRCTFDNNVLAGISAKRECTITDCRAIDNLGDGIAMAGPLGRVEGCFARGNAEGITVGPGCQVVDSEALDNTGHGIAGGAGTTVLRCTSNANAVGIALLEGSGRVGECTVEENLQRGVSVFANTLVANNSIRANPCGGIVADENGNRVEGNHLSSNGVGIQVLGARNLIVRNSLDNNGVQMQIAPDNVEGPFLKTKGFVQSENPWANFDLSFPGMFP